MSYLVCVLIKRSIELMWGYSTGWVNEASLILRGHRSIVNQVRYNYSHNLIASSGVEKMIKVYFYH